MSWTVCHQTVKYTSPEACRLHEGAALSRAVFEPAIARLIAACSPRDHLQITSRKTIVSRNRATDFGHPYDELLQNLHHFLSSTFQKTWNMSVVCLNIPARPTVSCSSRRKRRVVLVSQLPCRVSSLRCTNCRCYFALYEMKTIVDCD
jgi:hypothetical protein